MRAIVSRVKEARVEIGGEICAEIGSGVLVLLGVGADDAPAKAKRMADKVCGLRIFEDAQGKMNLNLEKAGGKLLVISNFTLYADCSSRRPGFTRAARPERALPLYELFIAQCRDKGFTVEAGRFGADMQVFSQGDGPVTIILDTKDFDRDGE